MSPWLADCWRMLAVQLLKSPGLPTSRPIEIVGSIVAASVWNCLAKAMYVAGSCWAVWWSISQLPYSSLPTSQ